MRHQNAGRKFDRNTTSRRAMFRNLTANLILNERIETTDAKAKELRRVAERLITKARRLGEVSYTPFEKLSEKDKAKRLATKRLIASFLPRWGTKTEKGGETKKVDLVEKVLIDLAKRFEGRPGGYTRIIKLGERRGDNAPLAIIELVEGAGDAGEKKAKKSKKAAKPEAEAASAG
ncbi:MAG: 50S ribosomal protein L17 [Labilithrix sp.]|nr:50S ribosomal protein L17 [Labilithrix sp.]MCW5832313.1 50S ribosomal protein L17 [Labilithrix sp.]